MTGLTPIYSLMTPCPIGITRTCEEVVLGKAQRTGLTHGIWCAPDCPRRTGTRVLRETRLEGSHPTRARMRFEARARVKMLSPGMLGFDFEIERGTTCFGGLAQQFIEHRGADASASLIRFNVKLLEPGRLASMLERPCE